MRISERMALRLGGALLLAAAVSGCGGPKTIASDGYTAQLAFSSEERYPIAWKGQKIRVEGSLDGKPLVRIARGDLGKELQFRPEGTKLFEKPWNPREEVVPGYPLEPAFSPTAYAERFGATFERIDDAVHGLHPCERYAMTLPSGDLVTIWVARDLERLVVKIEHARKAGGDEEQPFSVTELLDVRAGAADSLFEPPKGRTTVAAFAELD
ncbi:MAG TPA: hypothetical protein VIE39_03680 [Thermoanaerobaculia bacterium]|jgi:hypothetical protein